MKVISAYLPEAIVAKIDEAAQRERRSRNFVIRETLGKVFADSARDADHQPKEKRCPAA